MDHRQFARHGTARVGIIAGGRFKISVVVQTHLARTNAQHAKQDPHHQQRHIEKESVQRAQQQEGNHHHTRHHQQRAQHGKVPDAAE